LATLARCAAHSAQETFQPAVLRAEIAGSDTHFYNCGWIQPDRVLAPMAPMIPFFIISLPSQSIVRTAFAEGRFRDPPSMGRRFRRDCRAKAGRVLSNPALLPAGF